MTHDFAWYINQAVRDEAARLALADQQHGAPADIPQSRYLDEIADMLGITTVHLYRIMRGAQDPGVSMVRRLSQICHTKLLVAYQCREVGLGYYDLGVREAEPKDLVGLVSHQLQDASRVAQKSLELLMDGDVSLTDRNTLVPMMEDAMDAIAALRDQVIARTSDPTQPQGTPRQPAASVRTLRTA
jgi:transcriptional regulator with XRE-family HTH domain